MNEQRDTTFSILKALAILLVVTAHAAAPTYLSRFAYMVSVPAFFVCAGYFFNPQYLQQKGTFVVRRARRLYLPFVKWSLLFLVLHNLFFPLGLLSETYGNAAGGVTHPYDWGTAMQNLWSIVFNMSGYDVFLAGAFWFFRALFLSSIAFLLLFKGATCIKWLKNPTLQVAAVGTLTLLLAIWQSFDGLRITGVAQGGYRELMGITFMSIGFLFRHNTDSPLSVAWRHPALGLAWSSLILALLVAFFPVAMTPSTGNPLAVVLLALAGPAAFVWLHAVAHYLSLLPRKVPEVIAYIGDNSIYIFGFHLLAFKLVSMIKVLAYGLPWEMVGNHPVVTFQRDDAFWIAYLFVGAGLPLLVVWSWHYFCTQFDFNWTRPADWGRLFLTISVGILTGMKWLGRTSVRTSKKTAHGIAVTFKDIVTQSRTDDDN